jgi:UDP-N-acetyl-D-glucosamine dehydrogenase
VVGLGYVGLPLAIAAAESGFLVTGIDSNLEKVALIKSGKSPIEDVSEMKIQKVVGSKLHVSHEFSQITDSSIVIICVPTPLGSDRKPNLSFVEEAAISLARYLTKSTLVILESTVQPGTTRNLLGPLISQHSKLKPEDFEVAYSPERIDPANKTWNLQNTPKIVAGLSAKGAILARDFYSRFVDHVIVCESPEVAELAKLLENSFRYINISFINEFSLFCRKLGVDIEEVIRLAASKPYGFMPFYPGVGVGGHCIPIDPIYLSEKAIEMGTRIRFIELADEINLSMPLSFINIASEKMGGLVGKRVMVVGVSYKPNVSDVRETPVEALVQGLKKHGANVVWHDDLVKEWKGEKSTPLSDNFDLAIIATNHDYIDLDKLGRVPLINTRGSIL